MTREIYQVELALLIADECSDQFSLRIFPSHRSSGALRLLNPSNPTGANNVQYVNDVRVYGKGGVKMLLL